MHMRGLGENDKLGRDAPRPPAESSDLSYRLPDVSNHSDLLKKHYLRYIAYINGGYIAPSAGYEKLPSPH
jgi:hypothetical protein